MKPSEFNEYVLFSEAENAALDARSFEREHRGTQQVYVECLIRKKDVQLKPEERNRQLWLARLIDVLKYDPSRIAVEYPITFGRDTSKRADIVVFDEKRPTVPYIIVEVKQKKYKDGKEQLRSYAHATGAPLAVWSDGILAEVWHRKNPNYFMPIHELPRADQTIEQVVDQPWTIQTLIELEDERLREGKFARSLRDLIEDMEDEVLANAGVDVFEEVFKLEISCSKSFAIAARPSLAAVLARSTRRKVLNATRVSKMLGAPFAGGRRRSVKTSKARLILQ
jgi:type I restriction enzyme M protein